MRLLSVFLGFVFLASELSAQSADRYFFYKATKDNATFYILGSMHMGKPDDADYPAKVYEALNASRLFILEGEVRKEKIRTPDLSLTYLPEGKTLRQYLTKSENEKYRKVGDALGVDVALVDRYQPWFVEFMFGYRLAFNAGFVLEYGTEHRLLRYIDRHIEKDKKPRVFTLEGNDEVLRYMHELSLADQLQRFRAFLAYSDRVGTSNVLEMQKYWREGDEANVLKIFHYYDTKDAASAKYTRVLLYDRNARMAERLNLIARYEGISFVVTGALHLIGPQNILEHLKQAGFKIERL
jgi:uncharacterized protein YbaP (TraB family)